LRDPEGYSIEPDGINPQVFLGWKVKRARAVAIGWFLVGRLRVRERVRVEWYGRRDRGVVGRVC